MSRFCWACGTMTVRYDMPRDWWWCVTCKAVHTTAEDLRRVLR